MKNKKGFTLIELLAVIVILAVIMVIAVPKILDVITKSRESAAKSSAELYIDAINKNNTLSDINNDYYTKIEDGEEIDVKTIDSQVNIKGSKPTSGTVTITSGKVTKATLCIDDYKVIYFGTKTNVKGSCENKNISLSENNSLLGYVSKTALENNTYETISIKDEIYTAHVYNYEGNQIWTDNMTFGDENDVATQTEYAKNMVIVKVNGDLTINEGVMVTAYNTNYGGPKGLLIYVTGTLINNGTISMTARGAKAEGQNVYLYQNEDGSYEFVPAIGASGGTGKEGSSSCKKGNSGDPGSNRQTGGGGAGAVVSSSSSNTSSSGSSGTSYSGGTGGGGLYSASNKAGDGFENGAAGGNASKNASSSKSGGGAGNPGGIGYVGHTESSTYYGGNGTGGLLIIYSNNIVNNNIISSTGTKGGATSKGSGGGGSGGGSVNIFYIQNFSGNIPSVEGGIAGGGCLGGNGGNGTVKIGSISNNSFVENDYTNQ